MYLKYTILLKNMYSRYTFSHYRAFESEASRDTSLSMPALEGASEFPSRPSTSVAPTTATKIDAMSMVEYGCIQVKLVSLSNDSDILV